MRWFLHENPYQSIYGRKDSTCNSKREVPLFIADYGQPQKAEKHHKNSGGITDVWLHRIPLLNQPNQKRSQISEITTLAIANTILFDCTA
jgi:hypothetical protein